MCGGKETFVQLNEEVCGNMSLRDSSKLAIEGRGKVRIVQKNGKEEFIFDVYYVSHMKRNILSIGQLLQKGYIVHMENNVLSLSVTPPKLALANLVESLAIYPIKLDCGPTSNHPYKNS